MLHQLLFMLFLTSASYEATNIIKVDVKNAGEVFEHFWKSTGFCPRDPKEDVYKSLLSDDVKLNLALIGSLPNQGIKQIRIHWLFNLIFLRSNEENLYYDFKYLDELLNFLHKHNLQPGFELMGFPIESNCTNKEVIINEGFWKDLVHQIALRAMAKYGIAEVSKWKFETWNEPDLKHYNLLNFTLSQYLQYVNGCAEGLRTVFITESNSEMGLTLGGPAGLFRNNGHPLCWGLLKSCNSLGKSQCPIQFISFHRKGNGTAEGVLNGTLELLDLLHNQFPNLSKMPIANDEADIIPNWSNSWEWRADTRYASMIVKVISDYYKSLILARKLKIEVLSNDNAFLNYHPFYFTQRTLFARFQMNHTDPPHNQFIKKPVYSVMALLSFLGDEYLKEEIISTDPLLTVLATRTLYTNQSTVSIMMIYANSTEVNSNKIKTFNVVLRSLSIGSKIVGYVLDNIRTNPYFVWQKHGKPVFPTEIVRKLMRDVEEPYRFLKPSQIFNQNLNFSLNFTIPSVVLLHVCSKPIQSPGRVINLSVYNITWNEALVTWKDSVVKTKCIRTYEVEFESKCENSLQFERVNIKDIIFLSYHHVTTGDGACETTIGRYRVRAVDYWDQPGTYSEIISYP